MYPPDSYQIVLESPPTEDDIDRCAERVYAPVFRSDFTAPGFALLSFDQEVDSLDLRRFMLRLSDALSARHLQKHGSPLHPLSMMHFDQQNTTKFHLDGGPSESYLILGYEPSPVQSVVTMADFTRAAHDLDLTPEQFLADYNPLFTWGEQALVPYTTQVEGFTSQQAQILLINNSRLPYRSEAMNTLGVLHQATISNPDPAKTRIVNSLMLAVGQAETPQSTGDARTMRQTFLAARACDK